MFINCLDDGHHTPLQTLSSVTHTTIRGGVSERCLGVVWVTLYTVEVYTSKNPLRHIFKSYLLFSQLPQVHQIVSCFGMSGAGGFLKGIFVSGVYEWILSGGVWYGSNWSINIHLDTFLLFYSFFPSCLGLVKIYHILCCLEGVWEVSGGCLRYSGQCLGGNDVDPIDEHQIWIILIIFVRISLR